MGGNITSNFYLENTTIINYQLDWFEKDSTRLSTP